VTGWFAGSMDQLQRMLRGSHPIDHDVEDSTPGTPTQGHELGGQGGELDEKTIESYLKRYGGTDDLDDDVSAFNRPAMV
jgi:hypothetical protein